ncbi:MAG: hypothetical protein L3J79_08285, partial [Candidatus Marinimicrobia bacterium]|nr:hypothetical protein [Candidatus Neomarinimicrobiota bacterium]
MISGILEQLDLSIDRAALVTNSSSIISFTNNFATVSAAVGTARGNFPVGPGIRRAFDEFDLRGRPSTEVDQVIIHINDAPEFSDFSAGQEARDLNIRLVMIAVPNDRQVAVEAPYRMMATTPADYFYVETAEQVETVYNAIARSFCAIANTAPEVYAGQTLWLSDLSAQVRMQASYQDDGNPTTGAISFSWQMLDGPGVVSFDSSAVLNPEVTFSQPGIYLLELNVSDGQYSARDCVNVRVMSPCSEVSPTGMIAWWSGDCSFRDEITGVALDSILNQNNITFDSGVVGNAFRMQGDAWASLALPEVVKNKVLGANKLSFEGWIRLDPDIGNNASIFTLFNSRTGPPRFNPFGTTPIHGTNDFRSGLKYDSGQLVWQNQISSNALIGAGEFPSSQTPFISISPPLGEFFHFAMTFDGTDPNHKVLSFYINGVLSDRLEYSAWGTGANRRNIGFFIADDIWLGSPYGIDPAIDAFRGAFDEITLYDRDLSAEEVASIYLAGSLGKCPPSANQPPTVDAGSDLLTSVVTATVALTGFADDDTGKPRVEWKKVSGPGSVVFSTADSETTDVTFSQAGVYTLSLSASDDFTRVEDRVQVRVATPCEGSVTPDALMWLDADHRLKDRMRVDRKVTRAGTHVYGQGYANGGFEIIADSGIVRTESIDGDLGWQGNDGHTIEGWIRVDTVNDYENTIISWYSEELGKDLFKINIIDANTADSIIGYNFHAYTGSGPYDGYWQAFKDVPNSTLMHVAMRYDKEQGEIDVFFNGARVQTISNLGSNFARPSSDDVTLSLGGGYSDGLPTMTGMIDEWTAYPRPLSDAEILAQASAGSNGRCIDYGNQAPLVDAGENRCLIGGSQSTELFGTATDDVAVTSLLWSQVTGPATVSFSSIDSLSTTATFPQDGNYVLALTAGDGELSGVDYVAIKVGVGGEPPIFDAAVNVWTGDGQNADGALGAGEVQL